MIIASILTGFLLLMLFIQASVDTPILPFFILEIPIFLLMDTFSSIESGFPSMLLIILYNFLLSYLFVFTFDCVAKALNFDTSKADKLGLISFIRKQFQKLEGGLAIGLPIFLLLFTISSPESKLNKLTLSKLTHFFEVNFNLDCPISQETCSGEAFAAILSLVVFFFPRWLPTLLD